MLNTGSPSEFDFRRSRAGSLSDAVDMCPKMPTEFNKTIGMIRMKLPEIDDDNVAQCPIPPA